MMQWHRFKSIGYDRVVFSPVGTGGWYLRWWYSCPLICPHGRRHDGNSNNSEGGRRRRRRRISLRSVETIKCKCEREPSGVCTRPGGQWKSNTFISAAAAAATSPGRKGQRRYWRNAAAAAVPVSAGMLPLRARAATVTAWHQFG